MKNEEWAARTGCGCLWERGHPALAVLHEVSPYSECYRAINFFILHSSFFTLHFQSPVLGSFHYLALPGTFVVDAAEVEDAVDDDAMELFIIGL